jgi:hypothetical protein
MLSTHLPHVEYGFDFVSAYVRLCTFLIITIMIMIIITIIFTFTRLLCVCVCVCVLNMFELSVK